MAYMDRKPDPECPECDGTGWIDDPTACGDPDHCSPVTPCPAGCDPYWDETEEVYGAQMGEYMQEPEDGK